MTSLVPIQTRYGGCRFRSRLEARWAVFFDRLAIPWEYEPAGFFLGNRAYLPDFWLPRQNLYYEVKGADPLSGYRDRMAHLAEGRRLRTVLAVGDIPRPETDPCGLAEAGSPFFMEVYFPDGGMDYPYAWTRCDHCGATDVQFNGIQERNCECVAGDRGIGDGARHPDLLAAYEAARSARFEHGENG